jgi:hypothetical protein
LYRNKEAMKNSQKKMFLRMVDKLDRMSTKIESIKSQFEGRFDRMSEKSLNSDAGILLGEEIISIDKAYIGLQGVVKDLKSAIGEID